MEETYHGSPSNGVDHHQISIDKGPSVTNSNGSSDASSVIVVELQNFADNNKKNNEFVPYLRDTNRTKYEEAALYVQEGIDNDKFASHPNGVYSKIAFNIVHNPIFYITELVVCCLLLALAAIEEPALITAPASNQAIITVLHSVLEMILLSLLACGILLRFIWMKPKTFLYQRTSFAALIMIVMFVEAMVVLIRRENHFRVTRCLRPIFFLDSYLMVGVRRVLRQLFQCLKPIVDVMLLLLLMVAVFAFSGYYLFADIDPTYFDTYLKSFISLFITLTTANHPDVFLEAYVRNRAAPLFFLLYLLVTLFFFSNVLLGVLYGHFSEVDKMKFKRLFLHRREALSLAYSVLADNTAGGINFHDFLLFMLEYKPRIPEYQVMCIFKALQFDPDPQECLCLEEFYRFYEMQNLEWKQTKKDGELYKWYDNFPSKLKQFIYGIHKLERFRFFDHVFTIIVLLNALFLITYTIITSYYCGIDEAGDTGDISLRDNLQKYCQSNRFVASRGALAGSFIFTGIYLFEIAIRLLAVGPFQYFGKKWNCYDSFVIVSSLILLCIEAKYSDSNHSLSYLVIFRPVKLLRIVKLKKSYYRILTSMSYLGDRLISLLLLIVIVFYFYAIIGMEVFQGAVYVGCCENALFGVGQYYTSNITEYGVNAYWLNNFDNIYQSYITLYEQLVINNWFIIMEGYVSETTIYARFFFFAFWMTTTVCLSVAIAYIVDAFVFSIHAADKSSSYCQDHPWFKCDCHNSERKKSITVTLTREEINILKNEIGRIKRTVHRSINNTLKRLQHFNRLRSTDDDQVKFLGKGLRTKEILNLEKYRNEFKDWIEEEMRQRKTVTVKRTIVSKILNLFKKLLQLILE